MATPGDRDRLTAMMADTIAKLNTPVPFYGFLPLEGRKYQRSKGFMAVGRAIGNGGWGRDDRPLAADRQQLADIRRYVDDLYEWSNGDGKIDPMIWINEQWGCTRRSETGEKNYNPATSAFWRAIHNVLTATDPDANADPGFWASYLVWSDLYKISVGGNPTGKLKRLQRDACVRMMEAEIDEYQPSKILFLTGIDWAYPFLAGIPNDKSVEIQATFVEAAGRFQRPDGRSPAFVVAPHPQGKPGDEWASQVVKAFEVLASPS